MPYIVIPFPPRISSERHSVVVRHHLFLKVANLRYELGVIGIGAIGAEDIAFEVK
jgi:hypothetical protein